MIGPCERCGSVGELHEASNGSVRRLLCERCLGKVMKTICMWKPS